MSLYQPNANHQFHKHIFAYLATQGVMYRKGTDFNGQGGFQAYWKDIYDLASTFCSDLGKKPTRQLLTMILNGKQENTVIIGHLTIIWIVLTFLFITL